jgi:pimeloyl-ACP methyl ester carboxylesterase
MAAGEQRGGSSRPHEFPRRTRELQVTGLRLLFFFAAVLFGGCAYLSEKQGELIFRPTKETWWAQVRDDAYAERWIKVGGNGDKLHAWWLPNDEANAPAVLYLHGARWNLAASASRIERWRRLGFSVLAVDYRGFGKSTEIAPSEQSAAEDAEAAWQELVALTPGHKHLIVGHSLGGAIAVELAARHPEAAGLGLESTFTSVADMVRESPWGFLPVTLILTQKFDALSRIRDVKMPIMIAHGTNDRTVPFQMGERLFAAAPSPKRFIKVEGGTHHNLSGAGFAQYQQALKELKLR